MVESGSLKVFFLTIIYTQRELIKQNIVTTYLKSSVVKRVLYFNPTVQIKVEKRVFRSWTLCVFLMGNNEKAIETNLIQFISFA